MSTNVHALSSRTSSTHFGQTVERLATTSNRSIRVSKKSRRRTTTKTTPLFLCTFRIGRSGHCQNGLCSQIQCSKAKRHNDGADKISDKRIAEKCFEPSKLAGAKTSFRRQNRNVVFQILHKWKSIKRNFFHRVSKNLNGLLLHPFGEFQPSKQLIVLEGRKNEKVSEKKTTRKKKRKTLRHDESYSLLLSNTDASF